MVPLVAALVAVTVTGLPSATATAAPAKPSVAPTAPTRISDFDGDGAADIVIGGVDDPGTVQVHYASGTVQTIGRTDVGGSDLRTGFGASVLARDLNGDGYCDLAIGDTGTGGEFDQELVIVPGSATGLVPASAHRYVAPHGVGRFGTALALVEAPSPVLVVGAPAEVDEGYVGGAIVTYVLGADGLPASEPDVVTQNTAGVPGQAESMDFFGADLAASGSLLLVSAPFEDLGRATNAGQVTALEFTGTGLSGVAINKNSRGVPGTAKAGDYFGASLDLGDGYAVVGVPGQDAGGLKNVGRVQPFRIRAGALVAMAPIDQNSKGIPGANETGDGFGAHVAMARPCAGVVGVLVGEPAEDIQKRDSAGASWLVPFTRTGACLAHMYYGGHGLGAQPVEEMGLGAAVAVLRGSDATAADALLIASFRDGDEGPVGSLFRLVPTVGIGERVWVGSYGSAGPSLSPARG